MHVFLELARLAAGDRQLLQLISRPPSSHEAQKASHLLLIEASLAEIVLVGQGRHCFLLVMDQEEGFSVFLTHYPVPCPDGPQ